VSTAPRRRRGPPLLALAVGAALLLTGCGKPAERLAPVESQVRYQGKPLTRGVVVFYPDREKGNTSPHEPRGTIEADGRYKATTHPREGAAPGPYRVAVIATESNDPKNPYALPRWLIPERFGQPDTSGLRLEVRPDAPPGAFDLDLK